MPLFKVAIVGAGPAGYFAAQALQNQQNEDIKNQNDDLKDTMEDIKDAFKDTADRSVPKPNAGSSAIKICSEPYADEEIQSEERIPNPYRLLRR